MAAPFAYGFARSRSRFARLRFRAIALTLRALTVSRYRAHASRAYGFALSRSRFARLRLRAIALTLRALTASRYRAHASRGFAFAAAHMRNRPWLNCWGCYLREFSMSNLHSPAADCTALNGLEDQVFHNKTEDDDGQQPGKNIGDQELILLRGNVPAEAAGSGAGAEYEFRRNQGSPRKSPSHF